MEDFWIQIAAGIVLVIITGAGGWLGTRLWKRIRKPAIKDGKPSKVKLGPIQVFLPQWDGKNDDDFYQDGVIQKRGFEQGEREASGIHNALKVEYQPMYEISSGRELLQSMEELYRSKHSTYFIMTMSSKIEEVHKGFKAWHKKCADTGKIPPVLIATVSSAPGLADAENGIVRWYIRSDEESQDLANQLDKLGYEQAAAFCITRTPGVCDDRYGTEGFKKFCDRFDGTVPHDLLFYVTAKTAKDHVQIFLGKFPQKNWPGVFVIGYGDMVKNTLAELITGGYDGCIVCTSTLTDPQWRPSEQVLENTKAKIFTVLPQLRNPNPYLVGDNRNVVFFFARKTLLRVLTLSAENSDTRLFLKRWLNRNEEGPEEVIQTYIYPDGDILVQVQVVSAKDLK